MAETHFTPGPWTADGIVVMSALTDVCYMGELAQYAGDTSNNLDNFEANARLIAAAPDLYAALDALLPMLPFGRGDAIATAKAALSKARGEPQ